MAWAVSADQGWIDLPVQEGEVREESVSVTVELSSPGPRDGRHEAVLSFTSPDADGPPEELAVVLRVGPAGCEGCGLSGRGSRGAVGLAALAALLLLARRRS